MRAAATGCLAPCHRTDPVGGQRTVYEVVLTGEGVNLAVKHAGAAVRVIVDEAPPSY